MAPQSLQARLTGWGSPSEGLVVGVIGWFGGGAGHLKDNWRQITAPGEITVRRSETSCFCIAFVIAWPLEPGDPILCVDLQTFGT